jgi:plastocyanin
VRAMLGLGISLAVLTSAACSSSTMVANSCGSSGASANINATDSKVFSPSSATITHGQSVCWQNNGTFSHGDAGPGELPTVVTGRPIDRVHRSGSALVRIHHASPGRWPVVVTRARRAGGGGL